MTAERTPAAVRSLRARRMLGFFAALALLQVQSGPAWAAYGPAPRGFEASPYADLGGSACGGTGPTGLGVAQSRMLAAADGRLLVRTWESSKAEPTGSIAPWGIAPFRSGMYVTQPGCDVVGRTGMPPDPGVLGTPCNVVHADSDGNEIAVVADVCGTAITLQPGTNWPTVATRDGRIVVIDPEEGAVTTLVGGLASDPAMHLAWRGSTLYYARASGGVWVAAGGRVADVPDVRGLLAPTGSGLSDLLLVTTAGGAVVAVDPSGEREPDTFGRADDFGGALAVGDEIGILIGHAASVWRLDGVYEPVPPAPTPPPAAPAQPPTQAPPPPAAAPPPPAQAPPPAPPPPPPVATAPVAPSTSVTQVVAAPGSTSVATSVVPGTATAQAPAIGLVPDDVEGEPQLALEGNRRRDPAAPLLFVPAAGILLAGAALQLHREQTHAAVAQAAEGHLVRERFGRAKRSRRSSRAW